MPYGDLSEADDSCGFLGGFRFVSFFVFVLVQPEIVAGQRLSNVWGKPR